MGKRIDWYYHRKGWNTCKRSDTYLRDRSATVRETADAKKERFGVDDLEGVLEGVRHLLVARGKKILRFDLTENPEAEELHKAMLAAR